MRLIWTLFGRRGAGPTAPRLSPFKLGVVCIVVVLVAGILVLNRNYLSTTLRSGQTFRIHFARDYRLQPDLSQVKVNFVPVGVVTDVQREPDNSALVTVKVDNGITEKIRTDPTAVIRPTTLLGGNYFVDLIPGGAPGAFSGTIPQDHTRLPVELGQVAQALPPPALSGLQHTVGDLDQTLRDGGGTELDKLLADAPGALRPAGQVLSAAQGTHPDTDLTNLVSGLETTASVLTARQGQLDSVVTNLHTTTSVLSDNRDAIARTIADLPSTLNTARTGLQDLDTTLGKLRDTADSARPAVQQLNPTLQHLDPVLVRTAPFVTRLNGLLVDAQPLVQQLVPASQQSTSVLDNLRGPVLDRVNGPIKHFILSPYKGTGPYATSTTDQPMYKELAGAVANLDKTSSLLDANGYAIAIQVGFGLGSAGGLPVNPQVLLDHIIGQSAPNPQEGR
ncbi:MlaD family protein [Streptomyces sp. RB6PN25]|uniref:MlaD family protein n=1 Tax=Streptomyces humicola TaxID=2953240 RepID=A0ABT1PNG0_9ACTN|nr:MlaD family protein [Streptomyces humicola]MCQ4079209.1 MlaD family protein [Streptomyces humicola]